MANIKINRHPWLDQGSRKYHYEYIMSKFFVYVLASKKNGTLYIGSTGNLIQRVAQHKKKYLKSFTQKYNVNILVYFEMAESAETMVTRER